VLKIRDLGGTSWKREMNVTWLTASPFRILKPEQYLKGEGIINKHEGDGCGR